MQSLRHRALFPISLAALTLFPAASIAADQFDGRWLTTQDCPAEGHMTELIRQIPGVIAGSTLHGEKGTAGQPGYESIQGKIAADGTAKLEVDGILANRANAHGLFAHKGAEYTYTVKAHFDADKGTGTRDTGLGIESRPCSFTFTKQPESGAPVPPAGPQ